jgi:hypothetical protein
MSKTCGICEGDIDIDTDSVLDIPFFFAQLAGDRGTKQFFDWVCADCYDILSQEDTDD